jgi:hypothetical protein
VTPAARIKFATPLTVRTAPGHRAPGQFGKTRRRVTAAEADEAG